MCHLITEFLSKTDGTDRKDTWRSIDSHGSHKHTRTQTCMFKLSEYKTFPEIAFFLSQQINLQRRMRVTGLITQGAKRIGSPEYVKSYKVAYSDDGKTWRTYKVKGKDEDMVSHTHGHTHIVIAPLFLSNTPRHTLTHIHTPTHEYTATGDRVKGRVEDMMRWLFN